MHLNFDLDDSLDILKGMSSFNKSFGFIFRKLYSLGPGIFYSLFLSFCSSFYGSELWFTDSSVDNLLINWPSRNTVL